MAEAIKLKRGLIIEVNLDPTKGSETGKIRPCVVVTNNTYNERVPVIQVVPITAWSEKKAKIKSNVEIEVSEANGLTKKIYCRLFANAAYRLFFSLGGYPR
ncbi:MULTISPECIES: type II toxin-antitoxin system PemK/MazF family toxin [unclassified Tychonema]|uniref:type II toxin-antitoxin system PemK/MazF family toxin n=1 Tax=unclassified Tychonema TaxID=2642144 RepID=UPI001D15080C|nr:MULTISPECIES: type II toxin-antitoxin system PemK/MazF family toxin [unclassified Tychonema]